MFVGKMIVVVLGILCVAVDDVLFSIYGLRILNTHLPSRGNILKVCVPAHSDQVEPEIAVMATSTRPEQCHCKAEAIITKNLLPSSQTRSALCHVCTRLRKPLQRIADEGSARDTAVINKTLGAAHP